MRIAVLPAAVLGLAVIAQPALHAQTDFQYPSRGRGVQGSAKRQKPPAASSRRRPFEFRPLPYRQSGEPAGRLLDESYAYMRMTSPRPDRYLYGQFNPPRRGSAARGRGSSAPNIRTRFGYYGNGSGYGDSYYEGSGIGGYDGLGGYGGLTGEVSTEGGLSGGGHAPLLSPGDLPSRAEEAGGAASGILPPPGSSKMKQPEQVAPSADSRDSILPAGGQAEAREAIEAALEDLRLGWLERDYNRLAARDPVRQPVRVFLGGLFKYQVQPSELLLMLHQAVGGTETVAFELEPLKKVQSDQVFVTGRHDWLDQQRRKQTTYVSYAFELMNGKWRISEVGSSTSPITGHSGGPGRP